MTYFWSIILCLLMGVRAEAQPQQHTFPATGTERNALAIHAATDLEAMEPLIKDFQILAPEVSVSYREFVTNDLFRELRTACAERRSSADLVITSSVDHLVVLSNEGCARPHRSAGSTAAPAWTRWRDEVFGFTLEPAVIVYNRALVPVQDVPKTRLDLIELMRRQPERLAGRIGAYDIALSGIGYLFASLDARNELLYGRLIEGFGRTHVVTRCCSSQLLVEIADGRLHIGYNILGSYAYAAQRKGAPIGIVLPDDYVLGLSRGVMLPTHSSNPETARRFIDYLLSPRGQRVVRDHSFFFDYAGTKPEGVEGPQSLVEAGTLRPIVIGPGLLPMQDKAKREKFLANWAGSIQPTRVQTVPQASNP